AQTCEPFARKKLAVAKPTASPSEILRAVEIINSAQNTVVIAGGGCVNAGSELVALAQAVDAPVLLTGNAKGVMSSSHELCAGNCLVFGRVQRDVEAADVVVVVGTELSDTDLYNGGR
ncbi:MAG: acetolactate synthase, partial [Acidimicrobiaceae bacterium]